MDKLDKFEQDIEDDILEYNTVLDTEQKRIQDIIKKSNENIILKVNKHDLEVLKKCASQEGIPYQTLLSNIIHKFVIGQ
ncbi:hypothetical protein QUF74_02595 [Candidatus Halobeggiatoa sp. HSG11]|nr:hypothetical protein [Candidatus Halobeggiatoa sp. HSG11]